MIAESDDPKVTFRLTEADYVAFLRERRPAGGWSERVRLVLMTIVAIALALALLWMLGRGQSVPWMPVVVVALTLLATPAIHVLGRQAEIRRARELGLFSGDWTIALSREGIRRRDATGEGLTHWDFVARVQDAPSAVHVVFKDETVTLVPKSALGGPEGAAAFIARVRAGIV